MEIQNSKITTAKQLLFAVDQIMEDYFITSMQIMLLINNPKINILIFKSIDQQVQDCFHF